MKKPDENGPTVVIQPNLISCEECGKQFSRNCGLENHLESHHKEKEFKCEKCIKEFFLKWRLKKHQEGHNADSKFCHFFNNKKDCPFIELGCMFQHRPSPECNFGSSCNRKLCQFQHNHQNVSQEPQEDPCEIKMPNNDSLKLSCLNCDQLF